MERKGGKKGPGVVSKKTRGGRKENNIIYNFSLKKRYQSSSCIEGVPGIRKRKEKGSLNSNGPKRPEGGPIFRLPWRPAVHGGKGTGP